MDVFVLAPDNVYEYRRRARIRSYVVCQFRLDLEPGWDLWYFQCQVDMEEESLSSLRLSLRPQTIPTTWPTPTWAMPPTERSANHASTAIPTIPIPSIDDDEFTTLPALAHWNRRVPSTLQIKAMMEAGMRTRMMEEMFLQDGQR